MALRVLAVALAACGSSSVHASIDAAATGDSGVVGDPGIERFTGTLSSTATVPFGGAPYCDYAVTLENVKLDAALDAKTGLVALVVTDTMVEQTVGMCPYPPAPHNAQDYELVGGAVLPINAKFTAMLTGSSTTSPQADTTVTLGRTGLTTLSASAKWHRTDQVAQLDWTVMTDQAITLDRVMCTTGNVYCVGSVQQGTEYGCTDGDHLTLVKPCPAGCGANDRCN